MSNNIYKPNNTERCIGRKNKDVDFDTLREVTEDIRDVFDCIGDILPTCSGTLGDILGGLLGWF